jgi:hypothetical protein
MLPQRWSVAARQSGPEDLAAFGAGGSQLGLPSGAAMTASTRVLTLATESLDMMRSITSVFKESLDRAEAWVDRYVCTRACMLVDSHRHRLDPADD